MISKACVKCHEPMNGGVYRKPNQCPHCFGLQDESRTAFNKPIKTEAVAKASLEIVVNNNTAIGLPEVEVQHTHHEDLPICEATTDTAIEAEVSTSETTAASSVEPEIASVDTLVAELEQNNPDVFAKEDMGSAVSLADDEKIFDDSTDESIVEALEEETECFENLEVRPDESQSLDVSLKIEPQISVMEVEDFDLESAKNDLETEENVDVLEPIEVEVQEQDSSENEQKVIAKIKDEILELHNALEEPEITLEASDENVVEMSDYSKAEKVQAEDAKVEDAQDAEEVAVLNDAVTSDGSGIDERADQVVTEINANAEIEKVIQQERELSDEDLGEVALLDDVVTSEKIAVNGGKIASVERIAEIVKKSEIETAKKAVEIAIAKMSSSVDMSDEVADKVAERVVSKVAEKVADKVAEKVVSNIEAEKSEDELEEKQDKLGNDTRYESIVLTTESASDLDVEKRLDMVTAEFVFDTKMIKSDVAAVKNFSNSAQSVLKDARKTVLDEIKKDAYLLGANTVVDVNLEYSEISGGDQAMMFVIATGTAVKTKQAA
ncbi:MAG: heavy metal-binding domain-containing protein [Agarilytica sp.]